MVNLNIKKQQKKSQHVSVLLGWCHPRGWKTQQSDFSWYDKVITMFLAKMSTVAYNLARSCVRVSSPGNGNVCMTPSSRPPQPPRGWSEGPLTPDNTYRAHASPPKSSLLDQCERSVPYSTVHFLDPGTVGRGELQRSTVAHTQAQRNIDSDL